MKIIDIVLLKGRNIYSHNPVLKMTIDIGEYSETETKDIPGFNEKLLACFPNLRKSTCSLGYEGGFLERLENGTYLGHVLEHVIIDIQTTLGFHVKYGKTRLLEEPSIYYLVCEYENEICALECSKVAFFILNSFIEGNDILIEEFLQYLNDIKNETELGPSTAAIVNEARKRRIPINRIGYESLVRLGYGKNSRIIQATLTDSTSCISADISSNKQLTKDILNENKIPVPYGKVVYSKISAVMAANQIGMPVVIKPFNGNQGKGVQLNLNTEKEIKNAFKEASKYGAGIIVENYVKGNDYRILVVGDQVKAVSQRLPAMVIGDGVHTIKELVTITNQDPRRGENHEKPLTKIRLDEVALSIIKKNNLQEDSVLSKDEKLILRENANLSTGGTAIDCTDIIHPDNSDIAVRAAIALGIDIAGIDIVMEDISKSIYDTNGVVVEVNTAPGIRMHLYPTEGNPHNVAEDIINLLFPNEEAINFPIVSVTGTNGKTTTVRLINHILTSTGKVVGMTSTSGTFIGDRCICKGDNSGPFSAKVLLTNKSIDMAVLETARGGILRSGLGYDLADVGIVTNVAEDHLGLDGIKTLESMAHVKALVVEAVKSNGYAVLNAEDEMTSLILETVRANVILFYKDRNAIKLDIHDDTILVFVENGIIKIKDGEKLTDVIKIEDIPITYHGLSGCNIDNCLAAISALYGLKVPVPAIAEGLLSFKDNQGRFQLLQVKDYRVMLDYAHNPAGYQELLNLCKNLTYHRLIGVIGMPGDRPDTALRQAAGLAAKYFDKIYIKEDKDLRNRASNEVADIMYESIAETSFEKDNLKIILNEEEALLEAMNHAEKDDLIVVMYEKIEPLLSLIEKMS